MVDDTALFLIEDNSEEQKWNLSSRHSNDDATTPALVGEGFAKPPTQATRWLALVAVTGPVLFTLAWVVLGFLSPGYTLFGTRIAPYLPISQPVSGLGLGLTAPYINATFILSRLLLLAGMIGIFQTTRASSMAGARWLSLSRESQNLLVARAAVGSTDLSTRLCSRELRRICRGGHSHLTNRLRWCGRRELGRLVGERIRLLPVPLHHWQDVLMARQGVFERVAQVDQEMIAVGDLPDTWGAAFGSLRIHTGPASASELDPLVLT